MTKLSDVIQRGTNAARPAASAVPVGTLYYDTTNSSLGRSNGTTWDSVEGTGTAPSGSITASGYTQTTARLLGRTTASTGAIEEITVGSGLSLSAGSLTATGSSSVPGWMSWFVGTTDANNFYWAGSDLSGSFTAQTVTGSATWAENGNSIQALAANQTADDAAVQLIAKTISIGDSWLLAVNSTILGSDVGNSTLGYRAAGIVMADGTGTGANCVIGHVQVDNGGSSYVTVLVGRTGTLTNINTAAPWVSQNQQHGIGGWVFIKLKYSAANTFQLSFGPSPYQLSAFGEADISKTMTPTHVGLFVSQNGNAGTALAQFGPLKKV